MPCLVQYVRMDHGRADVFVAQKLLDGSGIVAALRQMSRSGSGLVARRHTALRGQRCKTARQTLARLGRRLASL